jgi:hypothetical protein
MQISQLKECTDCGSLEKLYDDIGCSILQLMKNKWAYASYGVDSFFSSDDLKVLLTLRRIIEKRLYNKKYPSETYSNQDLIGLGIKYLYRQNNCLDCPCEDFTDFITPCLCYTVSYVAGESSPAFLTSYVDCDGETVEVSFFPNQTRNLCAPKNTTFNERLQVVINGNCSSDCTSTTTSTTLTP